MIATAFGILSIVVAGIALAINSVLAAIVSLATDVVSIIIDLWPAPLGEIRNKMLDDTTLGIDLGAGLLDTFAAALIRW